MDAVNAEQVIFAVAGGISAIAAANAVLRRDPLASALSLTVALFALAVLYLSLGAAFLFGVQIAVYAGAIMVLLVFVIMLLGAAGRQPPRVAGRPRLGLAGPLVAVALFAILASAIVRAPVPARPIASEPAADHVAALADVLFVKFLFPFEIAIVLLLAALIAAVVLARKRGERDWPSRVP